MLNRKIIITAAMAGIAFRPFAAKAEHYVALGQITAQVCTNSHTQEM
jgi:hypothetical protein